MSKGVMRDFVIEKYGVAISDDDAMPLFERYGIEHNVKLPKDFLDFYSKYNGFKVSDNDLTFVFELKDKFWNRSRLEMEGLLSVKDILFVASSNEGVTYPKGILPFVDIELAEIAISFRCDSFGAVFLCEKDPLPGQVDNPSESSEEELQNFDPSKGQLSKRVVKLADSFEDFMST